MPRITNIEILCRGPQRTLSIRTQSTLKEMPAVIGESFGKMAAYLHDRGEYLSDVPFVAYHSWDKEEIDLETGFPVSFPLPAREEIKAGLIPGGKCIFCMYMGPYHKMTPVYEEMMKWISDNGFEPDGPPCEHYYNGPDTPEEQLLTRLVMPIK